MDSIELLKNIGFTEYEARVYLALCEHGENTAREISELSNLPRNKTYEILENLEKKKKVVSLSVTPKKFKIFDMNQLKEKVMQKKKEINLIENQISRLIENSSIKSFNEIKEIFWIIRSKRAIIEKMSAQNKVCKEEILSINRLSSANPINLKNMKYAIDNGTKVMMLVPNIKNNPMIKKWVDIGVEFREYDEKRFGSIGTRISIFDKKIVRITFGEPDVRRDEEYISLWAESTYFANMQREYFMNLWKKCNKMR